jgi:hypothetical protein
MLGTYFRHDLLDCLLTRFFPLQTWYGIGCLIIFLRYAVRLRTVGFRGFEGDDYVAFIVSSEDYVIVLMHLLTWIEPSDVHWGCAACPHLL